jgi:PhoH-like ATPase
VILHDATCIHHFEDNEVVIPISVLEELDQFKRGNEQIHFNARDFLRSLDDLSTGSDDSELKEGDGKIRVVVNHNWHPDVEASFQDDCPDHRIINCAYKLHIDNPDREIILVTKDTNMRLKSRSLGLSAEDYSRDSIEDVRQVYTGSRLIEDVDSKEIDVLYASYGVDGGEIKCVIDPMANENFILRNGQKSILATFDPFDKKVVRVDKPTAYGIKPRNAEQSFALHMLMDNRIQLVSLSGKAGTGKTLLALAAALELRSEYRQIFLARPIVPLSNRDLGFLPGDIQSKLDPYMQPLFDNLSVIRHQFKSNDKRSIKINELLEQNKLLITPLAYIRGRSLQKAFFIVDEAQNLTPHEVKTVITRAGEGTKVIFTGDIHQIDHPYLDKRSNGLTYLISRMKGQDVFAHITLEKGERSELAELASNLL